jgi:hypothetical protein
MAGLALGNGAIARYGVRVRNPIHLYAGLEMPASNSQSPSQALSSSERFRFSLVDSHHYGVRSWTIHSF